MPIHLVAEEERRRGGEVLHCNVVFMSHCQPAGLTGWNTGAAGLQCRANTVIVSSVPPHLYLTHISRHTPSRYQPAIVIGLLQSMSMWGARNDSRLVQTGTFLPVIIINDTQVTVRQDRLLWQQYYPSHSQYYYRQIENIAESHGREQVDWFGFNSYIWLSF